MRINIAIVLTSMVFPIAVHAATPITVESPAQADHLSDPRTLTVIDEQVYVMNHRKLTSGSRVKELYRLDSPETTATLLHSENGSLSDDDVVVEYDGALYHTITRKRGHTVQVYRSIDDGDNWDAVGDVGFSNYDIKNSVKAMFATEGRLYIVVAQQRRWDQKAKRIGVWSTTDGESWNTHVVKWPRTQTFAGAGALNNRPFLLVHGMAAGESPMTRLYTTLQANGSKLSRAAEDNISSSDQIEIPNELLITDDVLCITGTGTDGENVSLISSDGLSWDPTDRAFTQIVFHDGVLFGTTAHKLYASTDAQLWSEVTLSFEDDLDMDANDIRRTFNTAQDGSGIGVRVWSTDVESDAECWWSANGVSWSQLESCAPVQSVARRSVVEFEDFWYGIRGKNSHSVYRFAL